MFLCLFNVIECENWASVVDSRSKTHPIMPINYLEVKMESMFLLLSSIHCSVYYIHLVCMYNVHSSKHNNLAII